MPSKKHIYSFVPCFSIHVFLFGSFGELDGSDDDYNDIFFGVLVETSLF